MILTLIRIPFAAARDAWRRFGNRCVACGHPRGQHWYGHGECADCDCGRMR